MISEMKQLILAMAVSSLVLCPKVLSLQEVNMELEVHSLAFPEGERIPTKYTCEGQNISPPLSWSKLPQGTKALTLIMDDPDAPGRAFTHWVLFNLPGDTEKLSEAISPEGKLPSGALQGKNDFGKIGYGGPCPPPGRPHHYRFTLYALDQPLKLKPGASKAQVLEAIEGHILASDKLTGIYQR
jgi:hypothetical protein